jgi:hypothetical protein
VRGHEHQPDQPTDERSSALPIQPHRVPFPTGRRSPLTHTTPPQLPAEPTRPQARPHLPRLGIDRGAISERYAAVLSTSDHRDFVKALVRSVTDVPALLATVDRLWLALVAARRRHANLVAACRAAIAAQRDGEHDPLSYVVDELQDQSLPPTRRSRR